MFGKIVRTTFNGLIQWPDLMVFGLLTFALSFAIQLVFTPLWNGVNAASPLPALVLVVAQQFILTLGSYVIVIAATRLVLARLRGQPMSLRESAEIRPYLRPVAMYVLVYTLGSSALIIGYLVLLFGPTGLTFASQMMTTGVTGLSQVSTDINAGAACLVILIFFPLIIMWSLANLLVSPVIAAENLGGWAAIRRSWMLVRRTLVVVGGLVVTGLVIGFVLALLTAYTTPDFGSFDTAPTNFAQPQFVIFSVILSSLMFVIGAIFNAAWYYEALAEIEVPEEFRSERP